MSMLIYSTEKKTTVINKLPEYPIHRNLYWTTENYEKS